MAILFVDNLSHNKSRVVQIVVKAIELMLLSVGLVFTFLKVKGVVNNPYSCEFVFSSLMGFWKSIKCFLSSPLYICIIINFMVLLIKLSSTFHLHETASQDRDGFPVDTDDHDLQTIASVPPPPPETPLRDVAEDVPPPETPLRDVVEDVVARIPPSRRKSGTKITNTKTLYEGNQQNFVELANQSSPEVLSSNRDSMPKTHKITMKEKVGTKKPPPLSIGKEKERKNEEEDTMEATWKAITGGGKKTLKKKQLKKSETWDVPPRTSNTSNMQRLDSEVLFPSSPTWKELRKLETFNDAVSITRRGGLRRDFSMSLDDFNKQVDVFIKKINTNMKLQRQESAQRFFDMINR